VARAYAATIPPGRQDRLRMAIASLDLLSARLCLSTTHGVPAWRGIQMVTTTFPRALPCSMYRMALGAWLSG
jgi:hypothetical protein